MSESWLRIRDSADPRSPEYLTCGQRGHIIIVKDDGGAWGRRNYLSEDHCIIQMPWVHKELLADLVEQEFREGNLLRFRIKRINLDLLPWLTSRANTSRVLRLDGEHAKQFMDARDSNPFPLWEGR